MNYPDYIGDCSSYDTDATRLATQWVAANACHRTRYTATGALRGIRVGAHVCIHNIPNIQSINTHCLSLQMIGIEPDSDSVAPLHPSLIKDWLQRITDPNQHPDHHSISIPTYAYDIARNTGVWITAKLLEQSIPYCPYPSDLAFASHTYSGLTQARTGDTNTSVNPSYGSTVTDDNLQQTVTTLV